MLKVLSHKERIALLLAGKLPFAQVLTALPSFPVLASCQWRRTLHLVGKALQTNVW
jgi:hypothetical protein